MGRQLDHFKYQQKIFEDANAKKQYVCTLVKLTSHS